MEEPARPEGGVPGVQSNVVGGDGEKVQTESPLRKSSQVYNYEIGKTTSQIIEPRGQIRRLTVGVLIDGRYEGETYVPRSAEEIDAVRSVVMMAAGFSSERGDKIEVVNIPFKAQPLEIVQSKMAVDLKEWTKTPQGIGVVGGAFIFLICLFFLLKKRRWVQLVRIKDERGAGEQELSQLRSAQIGEGGESLPLQVGAKHGQLKGHAEGTTDIPVEKIKVAADPRREELIQITRAHKELVVQVIRGWLNEERQRLREEMGGKLNEAL